MSTGEIILAVVAAVFGSTGLFTFIQYLISRKDKKDDKLDGLKRGIDELKQDILSIKDEMKDMKYKTSKEFFSINDKIDRNNALQCRVRILRANDEMRQDVHHSYEYFRQLHQDITTYENYCTSHPEFKNNEAVNSIEYINRIYQDCLDSNNFLS